MDTCVVCGCVCDETCLHPRQQAVYRKASLDNVGPRTYRLTERRLCDDWRPAFALFTDDCTRAEGRVVAAYYVGKCFSMAEVTERRYCTCIILNAMK